MSEVKVDTISERTAAGGVTIDGVLIKDGVATFQTAAGSPLVFEGATADAFETTFAITDPTADRTITFPDASITLAAGGGLLGLVVYTGDGTYTVGGTSNGTAGDEGNADVTKVIIEVQGGGAGGARATGGTYAIGGSGGGYAKKFIDVSAMKAAGQTSTITVGAGGAGATVSGSGVDGGDSSWASPTGAVTLTVTGVKGVSSYGVNIESPGGLGTLGDINIQGGNGGVGYNGGGDSHFGHGGVAPYGAATDNYATGYGGGGGGGDGIIGGLGTGGIVLIWEYA